MNNEKELENFVCEVLNIKNEKKYCQYIYDFEFSNENKKYYIEIKSSFNTEMFFNYVSKVKEFVNCNKKKFNGEFVFIFFDKISFSEKKYLERIELDNCKILDISNILYLINNDEELLSKLKKLVKFSINNIVPEKPDVFADYNNGKTNSTFQKSSQEKKNFKERLMTAKPGKNNAKKYEEIIMDILQEIFNDELTNFQYQERTNESLCIFDLICKIKNDTEDEFYSFIKEYFRTQYIVFEFKNYTDKIKQTQICTTEKYLYATALRNVAIIISRKGTDKNADKLIKGILRESGKLIISLDDNDIIKMIELYEKGERPSGVLMDKVDEMLMKLDK